MVDLPSIAPVNWVAALQPKDARGHIGRHVLDVGHASAPKRWARALASRPSGRRREAMPTPWDGTEGAPSQPRNSDMPDAGQTNSSGRCRGQINIPTPDKGAAIVNANSDAAPVTDANPRAKWQSAMSRCHCSTIYSLSIGCTTSAIAAPSTVDACHIGLANAHKPE
jgi:hypothetical protein